MNAADLRAHVRDIVYTDPPWETYSFVGLAPMNVIQIAGVWNPYDDYLTDEVDRANLIIRQWAWVTMPHGQRRQAGKRWIREEVAARRLRAIVGNNYEHTNRT